MAREFICPLCQWHGAPSFELVDDPGSQKGGRLAAKCQGKTCSYVDPYLTASDFNEGRDENGESTGDVEPLSQPAARIVPADRRLTPKAAPSAPPRAFPEPFDVIARMRERRDFLEMEIARLEAMKLEHRKLVKMLRVAQSEEAKAQIETNVMHMGVAQ
jgi:hypothetical protein